MNSRLTAGVAATIGFSLVITLDVLGVFSGIIAAAVTCVAVVALPSARPLSARIAVNGAIVLGAVPLLWWFPWLQSFPVSRTGILTGIAVTILVFLVVRGSASRRALLPRFAGADWVVISGALAAFWMLWPMLKHRSGSTAVSLLTQATAGDNVAHFNMFEMIRRNLSTGPWWGNSPDGSLWAYVPYPQHFHVLVSFVAELWGGQDVLSVEDEVGLYNFGTAVVLVGAFTVLAAAVVSLPAFEDRVGISAVVVTAAFSLLIYGFGSTALSYGFPPFLLAVISTLVAIVLAMNSKQVQPIWIVALAAIVVCVAHTWILLLPLAGMAALIAVIRFIRVARDSGRAAVLSVALTGVASISAIWWATVLVLDATRTAGGPADALATPGAVEHAPFGVTVGFVITSMAMGVVTAVIPSRLARGIQRWLSAGAVIVAVGGVSLIVLLALLVIQLSNSDVVSYFQYKYISALYLVAGVALAVTIGLWVADRESTFPGGIRGSNIAVPALLSIAVLLYSGLPAAPHPAMRAFQSAGIGLRESMAVEAITYRPETARLVAAAEVMAKWPCARPIYYAAPPGDRMPNEGNTWAMSLSSTWSEATGPINRYLYESFSDADMYDAEEVIRELLLGGPNNCVVVTNDVMGEIGPETLADFPGKIVLLGD